MKLHCERSGDGPDVLLVHGWGLHSGVWDEFVSGLRGPARITRVDLPGHGRSEPSAGYTLATLADALSAVAPAPLIAVGWSLGALAVLTLAARHPTRVRAIVLIGATPRFTAATDWASAVPASLLREFAEALARDYRATLLRFLTLQLGVASHERGLLKRLRATLSSCPPAPSGLETGLALLLQTDLRPTLSAIDVPALVIQGGRDRLAPLAAGQYLACTLPRARLLELPDAGHAPFLSHRAACLAAMESLIHG